MLLDPAASDKGGEESGKSSVISQWENRSVVSTEDPDSITRMTSLTGEQPSSSTQPEVTESSKAEEGNFHDMSKPLPPSLSSQPTAQATEKAQQHTVGLSLILAGTELRQRSGTLIFHFHSQGQIMS